MRLAECVTSNVRSLHGLLTRTAALASLENTAITETFVRNVVSKGLVGRHGPITFEEIAQAVCERFDLSAKQLLSRRRTKHVAFPRQVAMYLCRQLLDASYPRIGHLFGRDHTTALHAVKAVSTRVLTDPSLQDTIETIGRRLGRGS